MKSKRQKMAERNEKIVEMHDKQGFTFDELSKLYEITRAGVYHAYKKSKTAQTLDKQ